MTIHATKDIANRETVVIFLSDLPILYTLVIVHNCFPFDFHMELANLIENFVSRDDLAVNDMHNCQNSFSVDVGEDSLLRSFPPGAPDRHRSRK